MAFRTRYFSSVRNVGDRIAPLVAQALAGQAAVYSHDGSRPHLLSIGSVLAYANPQSLIWGTGCFGPTHPLGRIKADNIFALRGKKTAFLLAEQGLLKKDVPLGDPGSLIGVLAPWNHLRSQAKRYRIGVIPHLSDLAHPVVRALRGDKEVLVLDVRDEPAKFLEGLASCRNIMSSSLHGIVFAEALNIPTLWVRLAGRLAGGTFKFEDYFSLCTNPQKTPVELEDVHSQVSGCEPRGASKETNELIDAFPLAEFGKLGVSYSLGTRFKPIELCRTEATRVVDPYGPSGADKFLTPGNFIETIKEASRLAQMGSVDWAEPQPFCAIVGSTGVVPNRDAIESSSLLLQKQERIDALLVSARMPLRGNLDEDFELAPPFEQGDRLLASDWMIVCKPFAAKVTLQRTARVVVVRGK